MPTKLPTFSTAVDHLSTYKPAIANNPHSFRQHCQGRSENVLSWRSNCGLPNTCPVSETTVAVQCS